MQYLCYQQQDLCVCERKGKRECNMVISGAYKGEEASN